MKLLLAPGASGNAETLAPLISALRQRGVDAKVVELPSRDAERALPAYRAVVAESAPGDVVIGGQSFGGRVASMLAAEVPVRGVVLLCYPLHAPGRQEAWRERTAHWPSIACPVLLLSGDADPFARIGLLREAVGRLPDAELVVYPGLRHSILPAVQDAADRIGAFVERVTDSQPRKPPP